MEVALGNLVTETLERRNLRHFEAYGMPVVALFSGAKKRMKMALNPPPHHKRVHARLARAMVLQRARDTRGATALLRPKIITL